MIHQATAYADVRSHSRGITSTGGAPAIHVRQQTRAQRHRQWLQQELRRGGYFDRYVGREKASMGKSIRTVARRFHDARPKSFRDLPKAAREIEAELQFAIPARLYLRLRQNPNFFDDPANLRRLKADNPELCIWT